MRRRGLPQTSRKKLQPLLPRGPYVLLDFRGHMDVRRYLNPIRLTAFRTLALVSSKQYSISVRPD